MLQSAWALRDVINDFIALYGTADLKKDMLDGDEQAIIYIIKEFLEKLLIATAACESKTSTLDLTLPTTDFILEAFEKEKDRYKDDFTYTSMFNSGQAKMNKYY